LNYFYSQRRKLFFNSLKLLSLIIKEIKPINNFSKRILGISNLRENKIFINPTDSFFDYPINLINNQNTNFKENQIIELEIPIKNKNNDPTN